MSQPALSEIEENADLGLLRKTSFRADQIDALGTHVQTLMTYYKEQFVKGNQDILFIDVLLDFAIHLGEIAEAPVKIKMEFDADQAKGMILTLEMRLHEYFSRGYQEEYPEWSKKVEQTLQAVSQLTSPNAPYDSAQSQANWVYNNYSALFQKSQNLQRRIYSDEDNSVLATSAKPTPV